MSKQKAALDSLENLLQKIEIDIKRARILINQINNNQLDDVDIEKQNTQKIEELACKLLNYDEEDSVKVIEGVYDGYFMIGSDEKKYPVPMNYSSKTKLIPGDVLKLRIMSDWRLVYKVMGEAKKKFVKATLSKTDDGKYVWITDEGKTYMLNQAAATFFKGKPGDELSIIVNADWIGDYAAIEVIISQE